MADGLLVRLGLTDYQEALGAQLMLHEARVENLIADTLICTEHYPVYTWGRTAKPEHMGAGWKRELLHGIPVCEVDRGGSVTYHGPGQLVAYPILKLHTYCPGPKAYMRMLEEVVVQSLEPFGLTGERRPGMPGVWIGASKIAAMGVRISCGVTRHGLALNVTGEMSPFSAIVPCGLKECDVTSMAKETGAAVSVASVEQIMVRRFENIFGISLLEENIETILSMAGITGACAQHGGK